MAMSVASVRALADHDGYFPERPTTNKFRGERVADGVTVKLGLHIFELGYCVSGERDENVADDDAGLVCGAARLYFKHNRSCFLMALERLAQSLGKADGL